MLWLVGRHQDSSQAHRTTWLEVDELAVYNTKRLHQSLLLATHPIQQDHATENQIKDARVVAQTSTTSSGCNAVVPLSCVTSLIRNRATMDAIYATSGDWILKLFLIDTPINLVLAAKSLLATLGALQNTCAYYIFFKVLHFAFYIEIKIYGQNYGPLLYR